MVAAPMLPSMTIVEAAGELRVIRSANVRDVVVTMLGATDGWTTGDNSFVLEFDSAPRKRLIDVDAPALTAMSPAASNGRSRASARLERGDVPGRYLGRITLQRSGEWNVTVAWGRAGSRESATFPIPVQAALKGAR